MSTKCLFALLALCTATASHAATWFVAPTGDDAAAGSIDHPFATIQRAQKDAAPGDTVFLRGGTNFNMLGRLADNRTDVDGYGHKLRNNLSYKSRGDISRFDAAKCDLAGNLFGRDVKLTDKDFVNLDESELARPRLANGDLPVVDCLHPAEGSTLVGAFGR